MEYKVAILPGDGIGPEIIPEAMMVLEKVGQTYGFRVKFSVGLIGGAALDAVGHPLPEETLELCRQSQAILLGAVGGPKWDDYPVHLRPEVGALLPLRKKLGLYANLRPVYLFASLEEASALKREVVSGTDLLVIRELTGGLYFGEKKREHTPAGQVAIDTLVYTEQEVRRIARLAFLMAEKRRGMVTSVDKANVLESSRMWREIVNEVKKEFPGVLLNHMYVDNCAMQLVRNPRQFDVIVTENMFGDILTDQASMLSGSIGMLASASIGGEVALYEPAHGSAPDIAGQGKANPLATILSAALMLENSFNQLEAAASIRRAVEQVLKDGHRTADLAVTGQEAVNTQAMGNLVLRALST
ncbi:MAG: 3-isopropylmalate dehydrogenase [Syntrophomonadaceae bacterium]|nr:3-isopropylmalate dehydrogenase [Syntrophomonadaceae bacterium]